MFDIPEYSFIQFREVRASCPTSLPVYSLSDISFFISIRGFGNCNCQLRIYNETSEQEQILCQLEYGNQFVDLSPYSLKIGVGEYFRLVLLMEGKRYYSNLFARIEDTTHTSLLAYRMNGAGLGWPCPDNNRGENRLRLDIELKEPQFPQESSGYIQRNGRNFVLHAEIKREHELDTDYFSEEEHMKILLALLHDEVSINGERYAKNDNYSIHWEDYLDSPCGKIAKASCTLRTDQLARNTNCGQCIPENSTSDVLYEALWEDYVCLRTTK